MAASVVSGSVVTKGNNGAASSTLTTPTYTIPTGVNRRLCVGLAVERQGSVSVPGVTSVKHNNVAMTQRAAIANNANGSGAAAGAILQFWDLNIADGSNPSGTIAVVLAGSYSGVLIAFTVQDADPAATPTVATSITAAGLASLSIASAVDSLVLSVAGNYSQNVANAGTYALTNTSGQTQLGNLADAPTAAFEMNIASAFKTSPGASTSTMGWTATNISGGPRTFHILVNYAPGSTTPAGLNVAASCLVDAVLGSSSVLAIAAAGAALALDDTRAVTGVAVGVTASAAAQMQTSGGAFVFVGVAATGAALTATTGVAAISGTVAGRALDVVLQLAAAAGTATASVAIISAGAVMVTATNPAATVRAEVAASANGSMFSLGNASAQAFVAATGAARVTTGGAGAIVSGGVVAIVFTPSIDRTSAATGEVRSTSLGDRVLTLDGHRLTFAAPRIISGD